MQSLPSRRLRQNACRSRDSRIPSAQSDDRDRLAPRAIAGAARRGRVVRETPAAGADGNALAGCAGAAAATGICGRGRTVAGGEQLRQRRRMRFDEVAGQLAKREVFEEQRLRQRAEGLFEQPSSDPGPGSNRSRSPPAARAGRSCPPPTSAASTIACTGGARSAPPGRLRGRRSTVGVSALGRLDRRCMAAPTPSVRCIRCSSPSMTSVWSTPSARLRWNMRMPVAVCIG